MNLLTLQNKLKDKKLWVIILQEDPFEKVVVQSAYGFWQTPNNISAKSMIEVIKEMKKNESKT